MGLDDLLRLMPKDTSSNAKINLPKVLELLNDKNLQFQTVFNMIMNTIKLCKLRRTRVDQLYKQESLQFHTVFSMIANIVQSMDSEGAAKIKKQTLSSLA